MFLPFLPFNEADPSVPSEVFSPSSTSLELPTHLQTVYPSPPPYRVKDYRTKGGLFEGLVKKTGENRVVKPGTPRGCLKMSEKVETPESPSLG